LTQIYAGRGLPATMFDGLSLLFDEYGLSFDKRNLAMKKPGAPHSGLSHNRKSTLGF